MSSPDGVAASEAEYERRMTCPRCGQYGDGCNCDAAETPERGGATPGGSSAATVWIPSVPLPFLGWRTDRCMCGQKFKDKNRRHAYELHYRREHQRGDTADGQAFMEVTRDEARRIYAEVNADSPDCGEDRVG